MPFVFKVSVGSAAPIFRQIVDQVRLAAATGVLGAGERLPSVRALAEKLLVNPNTVAKAYAELSSAGVIETRQGRGVFVTPPRQVYTKAERLRRIEPLVDALVNESVSLGLPAADVVAAVQLQLLKVAKSPEKAS